MGLNRRAHGNAPSYTIEGRIAMRPCKNYDK
jgi:hypothetical protein